MEDINIDKSEVKTIHLSVPRAENRLTLTGKKGSKSLCLAVAGYSVTLDLRSTEVLIDNINEMIDYIRVEES